MLGKRSSAQAQGRASTGARPYKGRQGGVSMNLVGFDVPRGVIARSESSKRRSNPLNRVAHGNPGRGHPRTPEGIAASCLPALLAMTAPETQRKRTQGMLIPEIPRGLPRRPCGAPRNDNGGDVAQEDPGHANPRNPEGIATSCLRHSSQ